MPALQKAERLVRVLYADSQAIKTWRNAAYIQARSALGLVNNPDYIVYCVRNTKSITGLVAIRKGEKNIHLVHLALRDAGRVVGKLLIEMIQDENPGEQIRVTPDQTAESFYVSLGWRKVGNEYWSR